MQLHKYICCCFKRKTEAQAIFLHLFTVCSLCKQMFVVCPFVDEETNESYPFANRQNALAPLRLGVWIYIDNPSDFHINCAENSIYRLKSEGACEKYKISGGSHLGLVSYTGQSRSEKISCESLFNAVVLGF